MGGIRRKFLGEQGEKLNGYVRINIYGTPLRTVEPIEGVVALIVPEIKY
jgi:hypothetical protein